VELKLGDLLPPSCGLAALFVGKASVLTVVLQEGAASSAQAEFIEPGALIDPGMDNSVVMAGPVASYIRLFLEDGDFQPGPS
jgi:hypothetical protein